MTEYPVFLSKNTWNYIQEMLDKHGGNKKFDWYIIKQIDEQLCGCYPHNHTW